MKEIIENLIVPKRIREGGTEKTLASSDTSLVRNPGIEKRHESGLAQEAWTRREFLKTLSVFLGGAAVLGVSGSTFEEEEGGTEDDFEIERLPDDFWFQVITKIYERFGEEPNPMQIRAHAIVRALGIPSGQVSALTSTEAAVRTDPKTDEVIAEKLTNRAGVEILPEHISSSDILDLYPDGLPEELKRRLDPRIVEMFELRYSHAKEMRGKYGQSKDIGVALENEHYFRLPGGIDLVSIAYNHDSKYQKIHGDYLEKLSANAAVITVEGAIDMAYGKYMEAAYQKEILPQGHFELLMRRARAAGFRGVFAEVDARDNSRKNIDPGEEDLMRGVFFGLEVPEGFRKKYLEYIGRENPVLYREIGSQENFKDILYSQLRHVRSREIEAYKRSRVALVARPIDKNADYVPYSEGFEFGGMEFSNALSAVKLHLIGKLMADGHITKGPILDIQGGGHLSSKSFFLRYPEYAMEVVLRTLPNLMSYRAENGISDLENELDRPDWSEVVRQVAKLAFAKTTDDPERIEPFFYDYLGEYGIDPERVIPSDREIKEIMEKTERSSAIRKADKKKIDREE